MRHQTFDEALTEALQGTYNVLVTVSSATLDPKVWTTLVASHPMLLMNANMDDVQGRAEDFSHNPTHDGFCEEFADFATGRRVTVTHRRSVRGTYDAIASGGSYMVVGWERVPGVPSPHTHLRATLARLGVER